MSVSETAKPLASNLLPSPAAVRRLLVWHQGALGDLLLALPTCKALAGHYPQGEITALGHPARWRLLQDTLSLANVWDSSDRLWLELYGARELSPALTARLAAFDLAVIFTVRPESPPLRRFRELGLPCLWLPSFPRGGEVPVTAYQLQFLRQAGIAPLEPDGRLQLSPSALARAQRWRREHHPQTPVIALAPGSGHPKKNWPLSSYLALAAALRDRYRAAVWWLLGPAEQDLKAALQELLPPAARLFLADLPLETLAAHLYWCDYYIGNDSGLTHLAAAVGGPWVLALFGPSDPRLWAPRGPRVRIIASNRPCAPCTPGREIPCPQARCLEELPAAQVLQVLAELPPSPLAQPIAVQHQPQKTTQKDP